MALLTELSQILHFNPLLFFGLYLAVPHALRTRDIVKLSILSLLVSTAMSIVWIYVLVPLQIRPAYSLFFAIIYVSSKYILEKIIPGKSDETSYIAFEIPFILVVSGVSLQIALINLPVLLITVILSILLYFLTFYLIEKLVYITNFSRMDEQVKGLPVRLLFCAFLGMIFANLGNIILNIS